MIDQLVPGMPQSAKPAKGMPADRHHAASAGRESPADCFDELVSKAGRHESRNDRRKGGDDGSSTKVATPATRLEAMPKVALDLTASLSTAASAAGLSTAASAAERRPNLNGFEESLKPAPAKCKIDQQQNVVLTKDVALSKVVEKVRQVAKQEQSTQPAPVGETRSDDRAHLKPADELGLLLGLVSAKDGEAKPEKKAAAVEEQDSKEEEHPVVAAEKASERVDVKLPDLLPHAMSDRRVIDEPRSGTASRDEAVRLVSLDGRGRPVDISLPKAAGEPPKDGDKTSGAPKIDVATVLEARRYLGFAPDSNATSLANAVKADPSWTSALEAVQRADLSALADTVTEVNTLKLQMNPENLGNMVASLKLKGEDLTVELRVDSIEAYRHLSADHDDIVKALQDQGFSIDKVTVQLNATDRTDTGADRDMARQGQGQREGQGSDGTRRDGSRQDRQPNGEVARAPRASAIGDGLADDGRSGNIYL